MKVVGTTFAMINASFDQSVRVGARMAFFASNGHLQLVHFLSLEVKSAFQAKTEAVY
jgi:hypothetical protein